MAARSDAHASALGSSPLLPITTACAALTSAPASARSRCATWRSAFVGVASTIISAPRAASATELVMRMRSGMGTPGRKVAFSRMRTMRSVSSCSYTQSLTSWSLESRMSARAVPHPPPPKTPTLT